MAYSNQVISNPAHKYYAQPGKAKYNMSGDLSVLTTATSAVLFPLADAEVPMGIDVTGGTFNVNVDGVYAINVILAVTGVDNTHDKDFSATLLFTGNPGNLSALAYIQSREPARGSDVGSDVEIITLSYTGFFYAGQGWTVSVHNFADNTLTVQASTSEAWVTKVY